MQGVDVSLTASFISFLAFGRVVLERVLNQALHADLCCYFLPHFLCFNNTKLCVVPLVTLFSQQVLFGKYLLSVSVLLLEIEP